MFESGDEHDGTLEELPRDECLRLLATQLVGRLAVVVRDGPPLVVPVNFVLDGEVVVFRSNVGDKLRALRRHPASFQVDEIDPLHRTGWSILMRGVAHEATSAEVEHLFVAPWAPGERDRWVRLLPTSITGRRIHLPELPVDTRGYL